MEQLTEFYARQYSEHAITDILLFGDCRPVHRPAIDLAKANNIRVHVFEEGYFRPYWITLERNGVNGHSDLSRDPSWYKAEAKNVPNYDNGESFEAPFWQRAAYDVGYNFWAGLNMVLHYGVKSHVPYSPLTEYFGYIRRGVRVKRHKHATRDIEKRLIAEAADWPFYVLPLQLATDAQIVHHSPFENMADAMSQILKSFSAFAPKKSRLAVKIHPLDPGLVNYRSLLRRQANALGVSERVVFLESGNLPALLSHTAGVVTVNSTVGASALMHNRPTISLGTALYNMSGLTYQDGIDSFWTNCEKPDPQLFRNFRNVVIHYSQINGGFYSKRGIDLAVKNSIPKLTSQEPLTRSEMLT